MPHLFRRLELELRAPERNSLKLQPGWGTLLESLCCAVPAGVVLGKHWVRESLTSNKQCFGVHHRAPRKMFGVVGLDGVGWSCQLGHGEGNCSFKVLSDLLLYCTHCLVWPAAAHARHSSFYFCFFLDNLIHKRCEKYHFSPKISSRAAILCVPCTELV